MTYERKLGKELARQFPKSLVFAGKWIEFADSAGTGFAQPDFYVTLSNRVLVFEAKLTQCLHGLTQLEQLYIPLLSHIYQRPCIGILVCRNLVEEPSRELAAFREAITFPPDIYTLHWMPR